MGLIKVLVVDDSFFMTAALKTILESDSNIKVIDVAKNGLEAITKIKDLKPDVITIDINMPYIDGIKSIQLIMTECPVPIVVISAYTTDKESAKTISALSAGAVDFIGKPDGEVSTNLKNDAQMIINKVKLAARANVHKIEVSLKKTFKKIDYGTIPKKLVLIGISTGGPSSLKQCFIKLKENMDLAIVVCIHINELYAKKLAELLENNCPYKVKVAEDRDQIKTGKIYLCTGENNFEITSNLRLKISKKLERQVYTPGVDYFFSASSRNVKNKELLGVVMTGMGKDGSKGVVDLYNDGNKIVVQDEKSSIIYGMPKQAKKTGKYHYEGNLEEIADFIEKFNNGGLV